MKLIFKSYTSKMVEQKGMSSSSSVRTSKPQLAAELNHWKEDVGTHQKKDTPCPRTKRKLKQDNRRGTIVFNIKPHFHQRLLEGTNRTLCAPGPKERSSGCHKRLSQTCLCVLDYLLCRHGSAVACRGDKSSGHRSSGRHCVWCKSSWRRSPLVPPQSRSVDN